MDPQELVKQIDRRDFLKTASLGALGFTLLPSWNGKAAASDRIRIAHVGVGGMGNAHMNWFAHLPEVEIVALCDVDELHLGATKEKLLKIHSSRQVDTYGDFRRILDRKDIDAITIATPDHWHASIASLAFQAGKDVYGEKPLSHNVGEGNLMLKNMNKYNRIFQMGNQIHASENFHRVVDLIKSNVIGNVKTVHLWKTGQSPELKSKGVQAIPKTLNWDMWLGPAPFVDYMPERCHGTFRYFLDYSGGVYADFWCHIADVVYSSLQPKGLKRIVSRGEKPTGIGDAPKSLEVDYEFDNLKIFWTTIPPNVPGAAERGIGAFFEGDKGTLICDYDSMEITINGQTVTDLVEIPKSTPRSPGHQQNFVDAVKFRKQPESNLAFARELTLPMHLGLISYRLDRELSWDAAKEQFVSDQEANKLLTRKPRKKWDLI
jgi:predicted dehydrogenase